MRRFGPLVLVVVLCLPRLVMGVEFPCPGENGKHLKVEYFDNGYSDYITFNYYVEDVHGDWFRILRTQYNNGEQQYFDRRQPISRASFDSKLSAALGGGDLPDCVEGSFGLNALRDGDVEALDSFIDSGGDGEDFFDYQNDLNTLDSDGDGYTDFFETAHGSDPNAAGDAPRFNGWESRNPGAPASRFFDTEYVENPDGTGQTVQQEFTEGYTFTDEDGNLITVDLSAAKPEAAPEGVDIGGLDSSALDYSMQWRRYDANGAIQEIGSGWPGGRLGTDSVSEVLPWLDSDSYGWFDPSFSSGTSGGGSGTTGDGSGSGSGDPPSTGGNPGGTSVDGSDFNGQSSGQAGASPGDRPGSEDGQPPRDWSDDLAGVGDAIEELRKTDSAAADALWSKLDALDKNVQRGNAIQNNVGRAIEKQTGELKQAIAANGGGGGGGGSGFPDEIQVDPGEDDSGNAPGPVSMNKSGLLSENYAFMPDVGDYTAMAPLALDVSLPGGGMENVAFDLSGENTMFGDLSSLRVLLRAVVLFGFCVYLIGRALERVSQA